MASDSPARDYLLPRLTALVNQAEATGIDRDVVVAVLIDIVTSPQFDTAAPDPASDSAPHPDFQRSNDRVASLAGVIPVVARPIDAQDEADFIRPIGPFSPS